MMTISEAIKKSIANLSIVRKRSAVQNSDVGSVLYVCQLGEKLKYVYLNEILISNKYFETSHKNQRLPGGQKKTKSEMIHGR